MTASFNYAPPKVWTWNKPNGGRFVNGNRPIAGPKQAARHRAKVARKMTGASDETKQRSI
jgi:hypothetical protein